MLKSIFSLIKVVAIATFATIAMSTMSAMASEVDFEVLNADGLLLSYRITNEQAPCEVELVTSNDVADEENSAEVLNVPEKVTYDDTEYVVTGVSESVFNISSNTKEVNLPSTFRKLGNVNVNMALKFNR